MNENMYDQDEMEINIGDLIKEISKRWKSIIVCAIVFAVLAGAFSVIKERREGGNVSNEAQQDELRRDYELLEEQYNDDMMLYDSKEKTFAEYSDAVKMLTRELDRLQEIPEEDEEARMASLIKISGLQSVVSNGNTMRSYYKDMKAPEKPVSFEEYTADNGGSGNGFSKKYAAAGFVIGGFIACFGWALVYLFDGTVKTVSELTRYYGINALGAPDKQGLVAANVKNFITADIKRVLVTGSAEDADIKSIKDAISTTVDGIEIRAAGGLNYNADTAIMLSDIDAVVLVERLKKSKHSNVEDELLMIRSAGKKLIGIAI